MEPIPVTRCSTAPPTCVPLRSASPFHDVVSSTNDKLPPPPTTANQGSAFSDVSSNRKFSPLVPSHDVTSPSVGDAALANLRCLPGHCCGSVMFCHDAGYEFFHPGSWVKKAPDPGSSTRNLSIFNPKKLTLQWAHKV